MKLATSALMALACATLVATSDVRATFFYLNTRSYYLTAGELTSRLDEGTGPNGHVDVNSLIANHEGILFIQGVADAIQGSEACPTPAQRGSEVHEDTLTFLHDHPERKDEPAAKVVVDALRAKFPCPDHNAPATRTESRS